MATTASGWPYVGSADHPLEYPAASQNAASLFESRFKDGPGSIVHVRTLTGQATDANGMVSITAAALGLATVTGAVASVLWAATYDGANAQLCTARVSSNTVQILVMGLTAGANAQLNRMLSKTGYTLYVVAWGT